VACKWIEKVGLACLENGRLLVVRKRGGSVFILPGGKPEGKESDLMTLARELNEELGCGVSRPSLEGVFTDVAAGYQNAVVVVRLYSGDIIGRPMPQAEIEELAWLDLSKPRSLPLAPSITNAILPHLRRRLRKVAAFGSGLASQQFDDLAQGCLELA
jgi:8-oxo-dGTP diphosphatase